VAFGGGAVTPPAAAIRPATEADADAIRSLVHEAGINPRDLDWRRFLVVDDAGEVVACAQVRVHRHGTRELASVAVREARRGEGLGRRISEATIAREPVRPLFLYAESANVPYWSKFAFVEVTDEELPADIRRSITATRRLIRAYNVVTRHHFRVVVMRRDEP
jgi:N-acetylglutamate synthase-like GNAT family acetyltransferase